MIDNARIEAFLRGQEISIATAREMVNDLYGRVANAQMNLRDQFACAALVHAMTSEDGEKAARDAYRIADQMIRFRVMEFLPDKHNEAK